MQFCFSVAALTAGAVLGGLGCASPEPPPNAPARCSPEALDPGDAGAGEAGDAAPGPRYRDRTATHLPPNVLEGLSMDAAAADIDGDGDLDIVIANEHRPNILLQNNGRGCFLDISARLPRRSRDSEDLAIHDFDGDGDLDIIVVTEDDRVDEYYEQQGDGSFVGDEQRIPVRAVTNGIATGDVDGDGHIDLVLANNGQNTLLLGDGAGRFRDATGERLPAVVDVSQDAELGDVDGDGDLDLVFGNERGSRLLYNDGSGRFQDAPADALPARAAGEETRDIDFGDIDGDGKLDLFFGNVRFFVDDALLENRLLLGDGAGRFQDVTAGRLPQHEDSTVDGDFFDIDGDGDLDLVTCNIRGLDGEVPLRVLRNQDGSFVEDTAAFVPATAAGRCFDVELADFDGDGVADIYIANRRGADRLLLSGP
ncbi:FG-GAP repeat domain-containing protein [Haliangium ochraceum]|uniref:FG-GAP repeat protein n=1 Tax=Haliangium ochraceum (strain DSM 14365 / JCM 11303 / SMP-2) TaxID=502025 RepID=D0LNZ8_HALO1|nr:VCBS repeat-containing protein [Haliangium ochraceum]ACY18824.1 FG-GAP repeat protein [Haliangium ochraceum DSM 14365]